MKGCLLFSGLYRAVEQAHANISENLIRPNGNLDIFVHCWDNDLENGESERIINSLYNPKKLVIEKQKVWKNSNLDMTKMMNSYAKPYNRDLFVNGFHSAWYSVLQCNLIKEQYRLENDFNYDFCIRARFDIGYNQKVFCSRYNMNELWVSDRSLPIQTMVDDRFAFSSNENMNVYCSAFNHINLISSRRNLNDGAICGETFIYETCKSFDIKVNKISGLHLPHIR